MTGIHVKKYNVVEHSKGVQNLIELYLIPTYLKRLKIKNEDRHKYSHIEDVLDPDRILDPRFEFSSFVTLTSDGEVIACGLNYIVTRSEFQQTWIEKNRVHANDPTLPKSIRDYCQHISSSYDGLTSKVFDQYGNDRIIYVESIIFKPEYRGNHTSHMQDQAFEDEFFKNYHVFVDAMFPLEIFMKQAVTYTDYLAPVGRPIDEYTLLKRSLSYDKFVILSIFHSPPVALIKSKL